ncbi:NAD(P)H-quinone oxidoreductase [Hyphobacterium sp. SN044]|uniref:NAD(P)H-quinone oxidoreductase n=1 Tax=Hyphobacterium sp. SN044 TaxID=2912575 RepID=UPI001F15E097|nr:NAD(P)H-quinone oxidoreductase [Hyphobacterium sp. SN044]MCF8879983.1 NAD(P)H-quinone oxidoreductase [Hyphobacterium sp. SN044]
MSEHGMFRAITAPQPGGPEALVLERREVCEPGPEDVRIRVAAAGVNKPDTFQRMGVYPPPKGASDVLGLEVSGTVDAVGPDVTRWKTGDEVCALLPGGGYAEIAIAHQGSVLPKPAGVSLRDAAGLPETVFTVWANVFEAGALRPGETFLIHGGAGGIGTTAIQMAAAHGARVIATAGSDEKCALCRELGAEIAVNYREADFVDAVAAAGGADVVLDMVGGDYADRNLKCLNTGGRLVQIAFLKGSRVEIDMMPIMLKRLTVTGSTLRARPLAEKARLAAAVEKTVWPWIEAGKIRVVADAVFPLEEAAKAHALIDSSGHAGKILLVP